MEEAKEERILVVCVDRDDDLGAKTGIRGPVIGREENLRAASELALADPTEADSNAIFGAVKAYDELRSLFSDNSNVKLEIATITGHHRSEMLADEEIRRQVEEVVKKFRPTSIVLVSDGADDEMVIPLLMSYAPIRSVKRIIVQQSREIEHTYILIKRYLEKLLASPTSRALVFGIPGAVLILSSILYLLNMQRYLLVGAALTTGLLLLDRGFKLVEKLRSWALYFGKQIGLASFIMGSFGLAVSLLYAYSRSSILIAQEFPVELIVARLLQEVNTFAALSLLVMFVGSAVESMASRRVDAFEKLMGGGLVISLWMSLFYIGQYMEGNVGLLTLLSMQAGAVIFAISSFLITLRVAKFFRERGWT